MANVTEIVCATCGARSLKPAKEIARSRKIGRPTYCSRSCAAVGNNAPNRVVAVRKVCPTCDNEFETTTHNKAPDFCSRSCASLGSLTEKRRAAQQKSGAASDNRDVRSMLFAKEDWKYAALRSVLKNRDHEFEMPIGPYFFDLALKDIHVLLEFDGPGHDKEYDSTKDFLAEMAGWKILRRTVEPNKEIPTSVLDNL